MTKSNRVRNITRGFTLKRNQALKAIENCVAEWVEQGISIRDLTYAESRVKMMEQPKPQGLSYYIEGKDGELIEKPYLAELHGLIFETPQNKPRNYDLISQANRFCAEYSA